MAPKSQIMLVSPSFFREHGETEKLKHPNVGTTIKNPTFLCWTFICRVIFTLSNFYFNLKVLYIRIVKQFTYNNTFLFLMSVNTWL